MEKFYPVQITYRGVIPVINKQGPIASVELTAAQIKELESCGAELLDPATGKPFKLPKPVGAPEVAPRQNIEVPKDDIKLVYRHIAHDKLFTPKVTLKTDVKRPEPVYVATPIAEEEKASIAENVVEEPVSVEEPAAPADEAEPAEEKVEEEPVEETATQPEHVFNPSLVPSYMNLSKSKRRKLTARWNELVVTVSEDEAYKAVEEWANSDEVKNNQNQG
jgi:hypothetical protein